VSLTNLSQSLVSHHLRDLKDGGLVASEKDGRWVHYSLTHKGKRVMSALGQI
jgi:DNA-binding transcriptional ArsR family regulator